VPGEELNAEEKAMQLKIDALKEAAAWPGADQRTPVVLASQLMAAELYQEGYDSFAARPDRTPADALPLALVTHLVLLNTIFGHLPSLKLPASQR
jgi:hypothetical protein